MYDQTEERAAAISEGIESVIQAEKEQWKQDYEATVLPYLHEHKFVDGGEMCTYCRDKGLREPHHHNVWGAMLGYLQKKGYIEKIGYVTPKTAQTHIGKVVQWRSLVYSPLEGFDALDNLLGG